MEAAIPLYDQAIKLRPGNAEAFNQRCRARAMVGDLKAAGELHLLGSWPAGIPADIEFWFQLALADAAAPCGVALTNAMRGTTP